MTQKSGALQPATTQSVTTSVSLGLYLTPTSQRNLHSIPVCLLKTAAFPVTSDRRRANANIFFDEASFISLQLATELQIKPTSTTQVALSSQTNSNVVLPTS